MSLNKINANMEKGIKCREVKKLRNIIILIIVIILVAIYYVFSTTNKVVDISSKITSAASLYKVNKVINVALINDNKEKTDLINITPDKWLLLYFGYTNCPDVCPIDLVNINNAYKLIKNKDKLTVIFISVDPARDIGHLTEFVNKFNTEFLGFSSNNLTDFTKKLGIYYEINRIIENTKKITHNHKEHQNYLVSHTANSFLLNKQRKIIATIKSSATSKKIATAIDTIITALN